jgi:Na+-transporting NADH:ubiquinone oxidoreductase subunit NqrC
MGSKTCIGIIGLMVTVIMGLSGYFVGANAEQNIEIDKKANCIRVAKIEKEQEKKHDRIDRKFDMVINQMSATNLRLERIATQLEERTK